MGKTFYNLSCEDLCDLMCGKPEKDPPRRRKKDSNPQNEKDGGGRGQR